MIFSSVKQIVTFVGFIFFVTSFAEATSQVEMKDKTIVFYLSGDNNLSKFIRLNSEKIKLLGGGESFHGLVLYDGAKANDSELIELGVGKNKVLKKDFEADMGSTRSFANLISMAKKKYPSKELIVYFLGHSRGILNIPVNDGSKFGEQLTLASSSDDSSNTFFDETRLVNELKSVLKDQKIDLLILNSCLMGNLEVLNMFSQVAKYAMASEYTICVNGTAEIGDRARHRGVSVEVLLKELQKNPKITSRNLANSLLSEFHDAYQSYYMDNGTEAPDKCPSTLAYYDLSKSSEVVQNLSNLQSYLMEKSSFADKKAFIERSFSSLFVDEFGYIDLKTFLNLSRGLLDSTAQDLIQKTELSVANMVVAQTNVNVDLDNQASHLTIYFPPMTMDEASFQSFMKPYEKLPHLQKSELANFLKTAREWYQKNQESLISSWAWSAMNGKPVSLRPRASNEYNEYFSYVLAETLMIDFKNKKAENAQKIRNYLLLLDKATVTSDNFKKHKSYIEQLTADF